MRVVCRIELLGGLRVIHQKQVQAKFSTQKVAGLLARLALTRGRPQTREQLMDLLWPESDPKDARRSLRVALASLRKQLEPFGIVPDTVLQAATPTVALCAETTQTDVAEFEQLLKQTTHTADKTTLRLHLENAVLLYQGDLLPGMYDNWTMSEQSRLKSLYISALHQLIALLEQQGDYAKALEYAHCAEQADPFEEAPVYALLRLYEALLQHKQAANLYWVWRDRYSAEFGGQPSQKLVDMASRYKRADSCHPPIIMGVIKPVDAQNSIAEDNAITKDNRDREATTGGGVAPLPVWLTTLFGRAADVEKIATLICPSIISEKLPCRLVTLTGTGGVGKTRLAVAVAERLLPLIPMVYFISLETLTDTRRLLEHIASKLGLQFSSVMPLQEIITSFLDSQPSLLVLDNMEHLLVDEMSGSVNEAVAGLQSLLTNTRQLTCLVTSRQRLDMDGEQEYLVSPLSFPQSADRLERLPEFASVQLYMDRARSVRSDFQLTAQNGPSVAALCARLEGIPLAIELAARAIRTVPPRIMLDQLKNILALPESHQRGVTGRHKSLRAVFAASYVLLPPPMRALFVRLSVFRGGWQQEAAQIICRNDKDISKEDIAKEDVPKEDVLDVPALLNGLVERSLVMAEEHDGKVRFRLLEAVRQYAEEQWEEQWEEEADRNSTQRRHRDYYRQLAATADSHTEGLDQRNWLERLGAEHCNLDAALTWSMTTETEAEAGLQMSTDLWRYWEARGYFEEGRRWLEQGLQHAPAAEPILRARSLGCAGSLAYREGEWSAAVTLATQSLQIYRQHDHTLGIISQLHTLGIMAYEQGDYTLAQGYHEETLEQAKRLGDKQPEANALNSLGIVAWARGDVNAARRQFEASLALNRSLDSLRNIADLLNNLGMMATAQKDYAAARSYLEECLARSRALGVTWVVGCAVCNLAEVAMEQGDYLGARQGYAESLEIMMELHSERSAFVCLEGLAQTAALQGNGERAARLFGAAERLREHFGAVLTPVEKENYAPFLAAVRTEAGEQKFAAAWGQGCALTLTQAAAYARSE